MKFDLNLPKAQIDEAYANVLNQAARKAKIEGFREGKAPVEMVEKRIGKDALYEEALKQVLPQAYMKEIKQKGLSPISSPKINPKQVQEGSDWVFEVEIAQRPEVKLGEYKDMIRSAKTKDVIWTPEKGDSDKKTPSKDEQLKLIFQALVDKIPVQVPEMLIEEETNRSLSNFLNQVNKLGLTIEQYLNSMNTTSEKLKAQYSKAARESLALEFILDEIAKDLKIQVGDKEIEEMISSAPEESRQNLKSPEEMAGIKSILIRRKTIDQILEI